MAAELGALVSPRTDLARDMQKFGESVGIIYQITDDYLDLLNSLITKTAIGDLAMGIPTLPVTRLSRYVEYKKSVIEYIKSGESDKLIKTVRIEDAQNIFEDISFMINKGDRIGLVGNNGVGKSTLLKIILGEIKSDAGTVKIGTNLEIAYFDQLRRTLDPEKTIAQIIGDGSDYIKLNGKPRHVIGYLRGFLFTAKRAMTKDKVLSGGEKNRVILAKLLARPSNLLVLDEPTNDLDIETLEVLEDKLLEYQGTLIIVTHDREFLDNVVGSILVFEDSGVIQNYAGGFSDWQRRGKQLAEMDNPEIKKVSIKKTNDKKKTQKKLTYKLKYELDGLPGKIDIFEEEIKRLHEEINKDDFFSKPYNEQQPILDELSYNQSELDKAISRWDELESLKRDSN